ncbi:hypothetical protein HDV06_001054 [Boothiomyces sp. JEL0866]|nr:hypothetical protein HDV06_001054 [Boothiomyces sp. JEL0866]
MGGNISYTPTSSSSNCCSFQGISCANGRVSILDWTAQFAGKYSTIAVFTGGLQYLKELHLGYNGLKGKFPSLAGLTNLYFLDLQFNQLTGAIPALNYLTNLNYAHLEQNNFTGALPSAWPTNITYINVEYNFLLGGGLTGKVPDLALPQLKYL